MSKLTQWLWRWSIGVLVLLYAIGLYGFFVFRSWLIGYSTFLALANTFSPFFFVPLVITLPLGVVLRSRVVFLGSLAGLALALALYGPMFFPQVDVAASSNGPVVTVMTFNLGPSQSRPDQVAAAIESEAADIVTVEELIPTTANLMRDRLGKRYPYSLLVPQTSTTGLLSRYPIKNREWFQPAGRGRSALHATLDANGTLIHVFAVHALPPDISWLEDYPLPTGLDEREREDEIDDLLRRTNAVQGPVIVMGDFNMTDQTRAYARASEVLKDAYREVGWGFGFTFPHDLSLHHIPIPGPFIRIDYVFHSQDLKAEQARVECKGGSDHCYLVAQLGLHALK